MPITEYDHNDGCSVTGGYVYRGERLPTLYGAYVYGDFCSGKIWALRVDGRVVTEKMEIADTDLSISSFGEDASGEVYILTFEGQYTCSPPATEAILAEELLGFDHSQHKWRGA